ncbi:MAG: ATP-binding protein [Xenococcus sp. MO_188.B8]|nr:ATP-binding protein [Xenococcus sp. MO_188.B8]
MFPFTFAGWRDLISQLKGTAKLAGGYHPRLEGQGSKTIDLESLEHQLRDLIPEQDSEQFGEQEDDLYRYKSAVRNILGWAKQGENYLHLAYHAAFPLALTPDLLHYLHANFSLDSPWYAVSKLLLSPLCHLAGYQLYEMDSTVRHLLLKLLKEDKKFGDKRLEQLSDALLFYIQQGLSQEELLVESEDLGEKPEWIALAYTKPNELAKQLALALQQAYGNDKAELIRRSSLTATFAEPLAIAGFQPLLTYSKGINRSLRGYESGAKELLGELDRDFDIEGIKLTNPYGKKVVLDYSPPEHTFVINDINSEAILQHEFIHISPYKGLKRFNAKDKDFFFGRERLIKKLIQAVKQSNLLLVLGASGSGKSSVVRAGVIPQLESLSETAYQSCLFTPNRNPFISFHRSLLDPEEDIFNMSEVKFVLEGKSDTLSKTADLLKSKDYKWLIFIDQFEELFTSCSNLQTRSNFIQGIVDITQDNDQSVKVILAMRSDFLEELGAYPEFAAIAEKSINLVAEMQTEELRQAIEQPAAKHGVVFEFGLVEEIIQDVQGQAGSLPLLQYTLDLLWQDSDLTERTLNIATYRKLGGVSGALQRHVNHIYQQLSPEQQLATKQILLRLVDVVALEQSEVMRTAVSRRAYKSEFTETQAETVNLLINQDILVSDDRREDGQATVEIAHEALLTSWAELKDWISDTRNAIALNNRLAEDAARWHGLAREHPERANEELLTGSKLEKAIELRKDGTFDVVLGGLSDLVNNFIDASVDWRERKIQQELAVAQKLAEAEKRARIEAEKAKKGFNFLNFFKRS